MDALELLLKVSEPIEMYENQTSDLEWEKKKGNFKLDNEMSSKILDPIDSIMLLAEQASKISPLKRSVDDNFHPPTSIPTRRPRAQSEPYLTNESWAEKFGSSSNHRGEKPFSSEMKIENSLPQMLERYSSVYNKNGRIGIYTKEERKAIINRFREKRKRRVWKKKIRYFCRKNLADRRVRVKGRFVKAGGKISSSPSIDEDDLHNGEDNTEETYRDSTATTTSTSSPLHTTSEKGDTPGVMNSAQYRAHLQRQKYKVRSASAGSNCSTQESEGSMEMEIDEQDMEENALNVLTEAAENMDGESYLMRFRTTYADGQNQDSVMGKALKSNDNNTKGNLDILQMAAKRVRRHSIAY